MRLSSTLNLVLPVLTGLRRLEVKLSASWDDTRLNVGWASHALPGCPARLIPAVHACGMQAWWSFSAIINVAAAPVNLCCNTSSFEARQLVLCCHRKNELPHLPQLLDQGGCLRHIKLSSFAATAWYALKLLCNLSPLRNFLANSNQVLLTTKGCAHTRKW